MPRKFVRDSKFRHVYGDPYKKTKLYENIDISKNSWDGGSYCTVNSKFLAIVLEGYGGGCFIVLPLEQHGRVPADIPKVTGHKGRVLDIKWNPFNANVIASAAEDACIKIWHIPSSGLTGDLTTSVTDLIGHQKKVGIIQWHPTANNVLASASFDNDIIIWNVETGTPVNVMSLHADVIFCLTWNQDGSEIATTCKDKKMRIIDPRKGEIISEAETYDSVKPSRVVFIDDKRMATIGTTKMSERQLSLWNRTEMAAPITSLEVEGGSGNPLLYYDDTRKLLYIAGKGESSIRYYEISNDDPYMHYLSTFSSSEPQRGFGVTPTRALDVNKCEVFRLYKLHTKGIVEPISMIVPRKSDRYQPDLYPNVPGDTPALEAGQWFSGENADPILVSLKDGFTATEKAFAVVENHATNENIFDVNFLAAPKREEDLRKAFYEQQDEIKSLKELLKSKELKIKQLEYHRVKSGTSDTSDSDKETDAERIEPAENRDCHSPAVVIENLA